MIQFPSDFNKPISLSNSPSEQVQTMGRFYAEICQMPALVKQARVVDQVLLNQVEGLRQGALTLIDQFKGIKPTLLGNFDSHLLPLVQKVLDELLIDAEELKQILEQDVAYLSDVVSSDWENYVQCWVQWYKKWVDQHTLKKKVLEKLVHHATHLINKDIQLVKDYQTQSLQPLDQGSKDFKRVNQRLLEVIEEPLKELIDLRDKPQQYSSLEEASEWASTLSKKREMYVDCLLTKIDHIIKEEASSIGLQNDFAISEIDEEIDFMKQELYEIQVHLAQLSFDQEEEKGFIRERLRGLLDHIEHLQEKSLSKSLSKQAKTIKELVEHYLFEISSKKL